MKTIKIDNFFKSNRVFAHHHHKHIAEEAVEKEVISQKDLKILIAFSKKVFSNQRMSEDLILQAESIQDKLDKFSVDFSTIDLRVRNLLAKELNVKNYYKILFANFASSLRASITENKNIVKFQYLNEEDKNPTWQDIEIIF